MASILILGGVVPLCAAILVQYVGHLPPCHFCMLQRYPYGVAIGCGVLSLLVPRLSGCWKLLVLMGALAFLTTGLLGLYHTGIEQGWVEYHGGCVAGVSGDGSIDSMRAQIMDAPRVSCSDALANFAGLSMASWNAIFAFSMIGLTLAQYRFERKRHGK